MIKKIIATFKGDHTGFKREFDCTQDILRLSIKDLEIMEDHDLTSDSLASDVLIEEARKEFISQWGRGSKNLQFGFEVTVTDSILDYFGVQRISQIGICPNCKALISLLKPHSH